METWHRLLLSWPWLKWREIAWLVFLWVHVRCTEVLTLQMHNLKASNGGNALDFWVSQLDRVFCNLEWLCEMKMEEIRGLHMDLNDGWHFRKFPRICKLIHKLPHFATWFASWFAGWENGKWTCKMAHLCLEVLSQATKIFVSWIVDLPIWALRISQVGPHFCKLEFQLAKFSLVEILLYF